MEALHRISFRLLPISIAEKCLPTASITTTLSTTRISLFRAGNSLFSANFTTPKSFSSASSPVPKAGWFLGLGDNKKLSLPDIVKAGDPVLHEPAQEVNPNEISSERIQKIIDDMIKVMRKAPGVGLAAPQIGIPLRIIVLEDTQEYISYGLKEEIKAQDRRPFDLLVILNPKLQKKSNRTALFFEGCLRLAWLRQIE